MKKAWIGRCLILLLFVGVSGEAMSQKMKVESFIELTQAEDPDAKDPTFRCIDKQASRSGRYCAIIKLITTERDKAFTFDLGTDYVPEKVVYRDNGEVWIYVPAGTNKIKISHTRHGQLDTRDGYYHFKSDGVPRCEEATVYRLRLHTDFNPDEDIIKDANKFATVKFKVYPTTATVILRKIPESTNNDGTLEKQMPLGIYHYRVTHPDYHDYDGIFELTKEQSVQQVHVRLNQAFGWLTLSPKFNPSGYTLIVDGEITTASSLRKKPLKSGTHTIEVQHPNYHTEKRQIVIQDSVVYEFVPQLRPRLGRLSVSVNKPGAIVSVDGKQIGVTPLLNTYEVIVGNHTVEVSCADHNTEKRSVTIVENQTTNLSISLVDIARYTFSSTPTTASLYIDNKYIGITPCSYKMPSGDYRVKLIHRKYRTINKYMHLDSSNPNVTFSMKRQYPQKYQFYLQPTIQCGAQMGLGAAMGLYLANVNVEGTFLFGKESDAIYWNYIGAVSNYRPEKETFTPATISVNAGYGFIIGNRCRITPRAGINIINFFGQYNNCSALTTSIGARVEYAIVNHLGVYLTPEYAIPMYRSDNFVRISQTLTQLNDYVGGFNLKVGCYLYF